MNARVRCIGILLERCDLPKIPCGRCWFATAKGGPTLVNITIFNKIEMEATLNGRRRVTNR
jgi:hypothetical protein